MLPSPKAVALKICSPSKAAPPKKPPAPPAKHNPCRPPRPPTQLIEGNRYRLCPRSRNIACQPLRSNWATLQNQSRIFGVALARPEHPPETSGIGVERKDAAVIRRQRLFLAISRAKEDQP